MLTISAFIYAPAYLDQTRCEVLLSIKLTSVRLTKWSSPPINAPPPLLEFPPLAILEPVSYTHLTLPTKA